jgi:glycosyltransferase involved in cell wall biosynthesis
MGRFDLVWVFKLRTANMFRLWRWPNSVLDVDDLPSGVYASLATGSRFVRERLNAKIQVHRWRRREQLLGERFSVLTVCSDADRRKLDVPVPVYVVPNGFSPANHALERRPATPPRLGFIGLFDHEPNVEGVQWFIRDCWPRITQALPDARLRLAGRFGDSIFGRSSPNIDALGWVEDADREISSWSLMVVPLRVGGGTRVKIAEGFSRKCPIVTTSVGAYGYDVDASDLIVTDDAVAFAEACVSLIRDPSRGRALAERAYAKYLHKWTWDAIAPTIWQAAEDCLSRRQVSPAGTAPSGRRAAIQ